MSRLKTKDAAGMAVLMATREPFFTGGKLRGEPGNAGFLKTGRLDKRWHASVGEADYVVYSYVTPIAWHEPGIGWVRPLDWYSQTTTQHQLTIDQAIGLVAPGPVGLEEGAYLREEDGDKAESGS